MGNPKFMMLRDHDLLGCNYRWDFGMQLLIENPDLSIAE